MGFFKKLKFWKKRKSYTPTKVDARTCDATTVTVDPTVKCAAHTKTRMDGVVYAANSDYERELQLKNQKIWKIEEELAISEGLTAEATSYRNTKVNCETKTQANSMQKDCANAVDQETVRRQKDKNAMLSELLEEYLRMIVILNEKKQHLLRERTSHIHRIKEYEEENCAQLCKIRNLTDEITRLKEGRTPPTEKDTEDHQQKSGSDHAGRREAGGSNNGQESLNQRHRPNCLGRKRNMPPHLQQTPFKDEWNKFHGQPTTPNISSITTSLYCTKSQLYATTGMLC